jgi:hypothetical protein
MLARPNRGEPRQLAGDITVLRTLAIGMAALLVSTWQLWRGQTAFPQVPLLRVAVYWSPWIDHLAGVILLTAVSASVVFAASLPRRRACLGIAIVSLLVLWTLDQHRLQPWAYHFALSALVLLACGAPHSLRWLRLLVLSVYIYSSFSKFDSTFLQTHGALFVQTATRLVFGQHGRLPVEHAAHWAMLFPVGELLTAVMLAIAPLRRLGVMAAVLIHVSLIALLGPWSLNHRWAVLIWNGSFMTQVLLLFGRHAAAGGEPSDRYGWWPTSWPARLVLVPVALALAMPLLEPIGGWDSWLSWGLYSARAAKVEMFLMDDAAAQLPEQVRPYCEPMGRDDIWTRLAINRWSLDTVQAPVYPHERFQTGVVLAVIGMLPKGARHMLVVRSSSPNRRSGDSEQTRWDNLDDLQRHATSFQWNALPRQLVDGK